MPCWLAEQFALAWDTGRFRTGLTGEPNDKDDWIKFVGEHTDVYMRHVDRELTMSTPVSTHFLIIKMGTCANMTDLLSFIVQLQINLQTIEYKYGAGVFSYDTYQFQAPCTLLDIYWETTCMPNVPRWAFDCEFELVEAGGRYPPAVFPEVWQKPGY